MERFGKHGDNISYVTDVRANAKGYEFLAKADGIKAGGTHGNGI